MAIGMNLQRILGALLLSLLASLCYAAEKKDAESQAPAKADAESQSPAKAAPKASPPTKADAKASPPAKADAKSSPYASNGARLYRENCQACHMADGKGATGAGSYPALANNPKLQAASYPVVIVMYGKAGMPWFNGLLTPEEIAAIVGYIRTNFGNKYTEPVTTEEVAKMKGPVPTDE